MYEVFLIKAWGLGNIFKILEHEIEWYVLESKIENDDVDEASA